jgi:hypothetical protein
MSARFGRWVVGCAVGIALGRVVVGVVADVIMPQIVSSASNVESLMVIQRAMMLAAGAIEGACIGVGQWLALRATSRISASRWILATAAGIAVGWFVGALITTVEPRETPDVETIVFFALLSGVILGGITGAAQAVAVKATSKLRWSVASAVAWGLAMVVALGGSALLDADDRGALSILVNLGTGVVAGSVVGAVTGGALGTILTSTITNTSSSDQKSTDTSV